MPLHFAEARANLLTNDAGDAVTGTGEYKVCAARLEAVAGDVPEQRFPGAYAAVADGAGG
jgi:predicted molibdopterin-dependent oxidoreductase YjgC